MLHVRNWRTFQHYMTRRPPWVKLHRTLLDDYEFIRLPLASQALAPRLWLLASESEDGSIASDPAKLAFRLHCSEEFILDAVNPLIAGGFLEGLLDASSVLAERKQNHAPETERETERERLAPPSPTASGSLALVPVKASVTGASASPLAKPVKPGRETWLTGFAADWREAYEGEPSFGEMARVLRQPVEALGEPEVRRRWRLYLGQTEGRFASPTRFAQTIGVWTEEAIARCKPADIRSMTVGQFNAATYERVLARMNAREAENAGQGALAAGSTGFGRLLPGEDERA